MSLLIALMCICGLAYANGANDNFKGVATLFGSGVSNYRKALNWATLTTFAGSIVAVWLVTLPLAAALGAMLLRTSLMLS